MPIELTIIVFVLSGIVFNIDTDSCMITHDAANENINVTAPIIITNEFNIRFLTSVFMLLLFIF